jgi:hypothetical protein
MPLNLNDWPWVLGAFPVALAIIAFQLLEASCL